MIRAALLVVAGAGLLLVGSARPAPAEISPECSAEAVFPGGVVVDPGAGDEFTVPRSGDVLFEGRLEIDADEVEARAHNGRAEVVLPPLAAPILGLFVDDAEPDVRVWRDDDATTTFDEGRTGYDIPSWVPSGAKVSVDGVHFDPALPSGSCEGSVVLILDGSPWNSPTTWLALGGVVVGLGGLWWSVRTRPGTYDPPRGNPVAGLVAGGLVGAALAPLLWALGAIDLSSVMWPTLPILGALAGLAGGLFPPLGRPDPAYRDPPPDDDSGGPPGPPGEPGHHAPHPAADLGPAGTTRTLGEMEDDG